MSQKKTLEILRALPVCEEPPTREEIAIFEEFEEARRSGRVEPGLTTAEIMETLDTLKRAEDMRKVGS